MENSSRVIINTGAQYIRSVISIIITLYTSRVVLENLGVNDFGIYSLVGGVVTMLAFIQNSLSRTSERFLNYHQGRNDNRMVKKVFVNSVISQFLITLMLVIAMLGCTGIIFDKLLNIASDMITEAKWVYVLMIVSLFFNLQSAPYLAVLISRENIVFSSMVQIIDSIIKIPIAISLFYIASHKLIWYAAMMAGITAINFIFYYIYDVKKYEECKRFSIKLYDWPLIKEMMFFGLWTTYSTFCVVGRTQGIAVLLNRFYTTAINSAFGIGNQIIGQLNFLSAAITTAITPQIVKSEGASNREKAIRLSETTSKFSVAILSSLLIPIYFYIDFLLGKWLTVVPEKTVMFCQFTIIITIIELFTQSFNILNSAIGNVKIYNVVIYTIVLLCIPFSWLALKMGFGAKGVMFVYAIDATVCGIARLVYLHVNIGLKFKEYLLHVFLPVSTTVFINVTVCYLISCVLHGWFVFLTIIISAVVTFVCILLFGPQKQEKEVIKRLLYKVLGGGKNFIKTLIPFYRQYSDLKGMRIPANYFVFLWQNIFSSIYWYHPSSMYIGMPRRIYVGKNCNVGRTLNFFQAKGGIWIGDNCEFATRVSLLTSNHDLYNQNVSHSSPIEIGNYCWLGMNSTILAGVKIGPRTIVANGAVVNKSFPEGFCVLAGIPAKIVKRLDPEKFDTTNFVRNRDYYGLKPASKVERNMIKFFNKYLDKKIFKIINDKIVLR